MEDMVEDLFLRMGLPEPRFSEDDASSDEERAEPSRIKNYVELTVMLYSDADFKSHFRLNKETVYDLIERFADSGFKLPYSNGRPAATFGKTFLLTLWYLANLETFRQCADRFDVSYSSAHRALICTLRFINSLIGDYVQWPDDDDASVIEEGFRAKRGIRGIIGAIDGCHIEIRRPQYHEEDYLNRKSYHRIILQGIVDHNKRFIDVYVGEPGSMHDARVLRRSPIFERAQDPNFFRGYSILGDSAYPNIPWLLPPIRDNGALNAEQRRFNFRHSSSRIVVEHAFGALKMVFRRLLRFDNLKVEIVVNCVTAATVLHNIHINDFLENNV